ncbi:MAG: hypothetical protein KGL39_17480 [Patescibacteria group bacterium]|nr:hypothetical protein [Patescibacteria group bacterium]
MPAGYGTRCRVCNSPLRAEADKHRLDDGWSERQVHRWLEESGVEASRESVRSHFRNHTSVREEAREQYEQAKTVHEAAVEKRVSDIERLDWAIGANAEIAQAYMPAAKDAMSKGEKLGLAQVTAGTAAFSELRQAIAAKAKLLGDTPQDDLAEMLVRALSGEDAATDG